MTKTHIIAPWTVYACDDYHAKGGSSDAIGVFATGREALAYAKEYTLPEIWGSINIEDRDNTRTYSHEQLSDMPIENIHICHPAGPLAPVPLPVITVSGYFVQSKSMISFMYNEGTLPAIYLTKQHRQENKPMKSVFGHAITGMPLHITYTLTHTETTDDGVPTFHRDDTITCIIYRICPKTAHIIDQHTTSTITLRTGQLHTLRDALSDAIQQHPNITEHTRISLLASIPTMDIEDVFTFLPATYTLD